MLPKPEPKERQFEFVPRCISAVRTANPTIADDEAGAMCFMAWQCRYESAAPVDGASTADWSAVDKSRLPAECFLYVPDASNRSTWRVPVYMGAGGIDPKTGLFRERGEINLNALRLENANSLPKSVKARLKALRKQYEFVETRTPEYATPTIEEAGDKPSRLVETIDFAGAEFVEEEGGKRTVKNVVMLGPVSSHGYEYRQEAMAKAVEGKLYEGARCFINHAPGGRNLMDLAGRFANTRHEGGKVRGDASLLPTEAGNLFWHIAKTMPEAAGCSHVADGKLVKGDDGKRYVEEITRVHSVDLVVQGATTQNVFEGEAPDTKRKEQPMEFKDIQLSDLRTARPDLVRQLVQEGATSRDEEIQALITEKRALVTEKDALTKDKAALSEEKTKLQAKLDEAAVVEATRQKEAVVDKALAELPEQARTQTFKDICLNVTTGTNGFDLKVFEAKVAELVKDRKELCEAKGVRHMGGDKQETKDLKPESEGSFTLKL